MANRRVQKVLSRRPGEEGFSLIELVVVVAVLAVLAAIAIPAYNNVTEKGRTSAAKTALSDAAKECMVSKTDSGTGVHTALTDGSGVTYAASLQGTACTDTAAVACVNNATKAQYAVNLATGAKVASGAAITAVSPCNTAVADGW